MWKSSRRLDRGLRTGMALSAGVLIVSGVVGGWTTVRLGAVVLLLVLAGAVDPPLRGRSGPSTCRVDRESGATRQDGIGPGRCGPPPRRSATPPSG